MTETRAAVIESTGAPFTIDTITLDEPRADEVVVRIVAAGLCHTDLVVQGGAIPFKFPGVLGHEGAGVVERVGAGVTKVKPGDRVLLSFTSCGRCVKCRAGHPAYCLEFVPRNLICGTRPDGSAPLHRGDEEIGGSFFGQSSFAEVALVTERSIVKVADDLSDDDLSIIAPLGCGVQTGIGAIWNILKPEPGSTIAVFGNGAVGLSAIYAASQTPDATIVAIDLVAERLETAKEFGATHTIDASTQDVAEELGKLTGGLGLDYAVETTGVPAVLKTAVLALGVDGTCGVIGAPSVAGAEVSLGVQDMLVGKKVIGITEGDSEPETLLPVLVDLYRSGSFPLRSIVAHYKLDEINAATDDMHHGKTIKPVIRL